MNDKTLLKVLKSLVDRISNLEKIGIPKDGKTPQKNIDYFDGKDGRDGVDGINGKDGKDGLPGKDGKDFTFDMFTAEQLLQLKGKDGKDGLPGINGRDGRDGVDGKDGKNGRSIKGKDGADGKDGRGIEDVYIDENGHLIIVFTDGEKKDVGKVVGENGVSGFGIQGQRGPIGIGISNTEVRSDGHLYVTLTNGQEIDAGYIGSGGGGGTGNVSSNTVQNLWTGTQSEYDALEVKSNSTLYFIVESSVEPVEPTETEGFKWNQAKWNTSVFNKSPDVILPPQ